MAISATSMPLHNLVGVYFFRIDALGLVTMLGAEQVNAIVGRLVRSRYTEYLPLLGAFVIASNQFTASMPGFAFYNIDSSMTSTDLAGWFTRWLLAQRFERSSSTVTWTVRETPSPIALDTAIALVISMLLNGGLIVLTVLMDDWFGLTNAIAMLVSVFVRAYVANQNRDALDAAAKLHGGDKVVKILCILSDGKAVTMHAPEGLLMHCFITKPKPPNPRLYTAARVLGWVGFAVHVIVIGMAALLSQTYTVALMVISTVLTMYRFGSDDTRIGSYIEAKIGKHVGDRRIDAYVALKLTDEELESMKKWNLVPHDRNEGWWKQYHEKVDRRKDSATSSGVTIDGKEVAVVARRVNAGEQV